MTDFWTDKRVLITGGAGYLAYSLLNLLKDQAATIIRLDRPGADFFSVSGTASIKNVQADIRDSTIWKSWVPDTDIIFHLAAQTSVPKADADPAADMAVNVLPMVALLEECRRAGTSPVVVFAGTATECGLTDTLPVNESVEDHPVTSYDMNKWMAETCLKYADAQNTVRGVTLRMANLYGPGPRSGAADRGILNLMVRRALAGEPLTVYGTGEYVRDYLFVEDAARAFMLAAENMESVHGGHFVIGSEAGTTIREAFELVAERVAVQSGVRAAVKSVEPPAPLPLIETRNFVADATRFKTQTGWRAEVSLQEGIDRTVRFFREGFPVNIGGI